MPGLDPSFAELKNDNVLKWVPKNNRQNHFWHGSKPQNRYLHFTNVDQTHRLFNAVGLKLCWFNNTQNIANTTFEGEVHFHELEFVAQKETPSIPLPRFLNAKRRVEALENGEHNNNDALCY